MAEKSMVSAKIAERTKDRLDDHAEREGISRSQMIDRMLKQGLDVEEGDVKTVPIVDDGTKDDTEDLVVANSPLNENPYSVMTFGVVVLIALRVFGIV
jgi:hypothetical protein